MRVPGRFEEHECTFITWPCFTDLEINNFEKEIVSFAKKLSNYEKVVIISDPSNYKKAHQYCNDIASIFSISTDWSWIRDNGPIFVKNEDEMKKGNLYGLVGNIVVFSFITLMITGGTIAVFGEYIAQPTDMVAKFDNLLLTIIAAFAFFSATVGINMVANFVPPAYDLANLIPSKINFRVGGLITAICGFVIGGLWVSVITQMGIFPFVNTLGAILAPVFGIMIVDYYIIKKETISLNDLYSDNKGKKYHYNDGFNYKGMIAWIISGYIAVGTVWPNILIIDGLTNFFANLGGGGGYAWMIGAALGALIHLGISQKNK